MMLMFSGEPSWTLSVDTGATATAEEGTGDKRRGTCGDGHVCSPFQCRIRPKQHEWRAMLQQIHGLLQLQVVQCEHFLAHFLASYIGGLLSWYAEMPT